MATQSVQDLTRTARQAFPGTSPVVERHGEHGFTLGPTPWGRTGLFQEGTEAVIWVMAAQPPPPVTDPAKIPPAIRRAAEELGLIPWCRIETNDCASAIRRLGREARTSGTDNENGMNLPLLPPPPQKKLIGDLRIPPLEQLAALLEVHLPGAPIPFLWGERKVGKRVLAAEAATRAHLTIRAELRLRQIVWDSVLQYGLEKIIDTFNDLASLFGPDDVLLVSDAHLLSAIRPTTSVVRDEIVLQTIADLPFPVILTAVREISRAGTQILPIYTPGLEGMTEVQAFLESAHQGIHPQRAAVDLLMRGATVESDEGNTIAPGRISYLVELALALAPRAMEPFGESEARVLVPDDIVAATSCVGPTWGRSQAPWSSDMGEHY